jgi:hypothetical protein
MTETKKIKKKKFFFFFFSFFLLCLLDIKYDLQVLHIIKSCHTIIQYDDPLKNKNYRFLQIEKRKEV